MFCGHEKVGDFHLNSDKKRKHCASSRYFGFFFLVVDAKENGEEKYQIEKGGKNTYMSMK